MAIHRNTFDGGLDTNTSHNLIPPNKYVNADNVNIAAENNFFALENIRGTTAITTLLPTENTVVLGVFSTNYKIGTSLNVPCLTIITATDAGASSTYKIWAHDVDNNALYELYEETFDGTDFFTTDRVVSAFVYPENGIDVLYFTDFYNELRKLTCHIELPYVANAFVTCGIKLLQYGGNGYNSVRNVSEGGSLFCGSYQFAYQLLNPTTGQSSKFSLFSNPIQVYLTAPDSFNLVRSGVGIQSSKKIEIEMHVPGDEVECFTHYRFAVIENIEPSGVNVTKAYLTQLEELERSESFTEYLQYYEYTSNARLESIDLSEIVVDKAAIKTAKTLTVRENRLVAGNIKYRDLSYDKGVPEITGGSILRQGSSTYDNLFSDPEESSKYRGYFRDEVYRFAISYFDEDGNYSFPSVLDMSAVTNNQISGEYKDMKFPARSQKLGSDTYGLFKNGAGIQSLGLQLTGIVNHPTWAKGFVILRARRIKNVLFQTPLIPMNHAFGVGALEDYPHQAVEISGTADRTVARPDDTPMGPFETYVPRNYFWDNASDIREFSITGGAVGSNKDKRFSGEAYLTSNPRFELGIIFPPEFMYEDKPFLFSPNYRIKTVDAALMKTTVSNFSDIDLGTTTEGKNIKTSVAATFYALKDNQYYYDSNHSGVKTVLASSTVGLNDFEPFDNLNSGSSLGGFNLFRYDKLTTNGAVTGVPATVQKCGVVKLDTAKFEINYTSSLSFQAGTQIAKSITTHEQAYNLSTSGFRQTIEIVNVEAGLDDDRYGKFDTPHEFISTGAHYFFAPLELDSVEAGISTPITVSVWGGDCYVTPHLFKLSDTSYGVTNSDKFISLVGDGIITALQNWERVYSDLDTGTNCVMSTPVPYKNSAQYIQIVLESEYNSGVIDNEVVNTLATDGIMATKMPILGLNSDSEGSCRVPLTYRINQNHKKENSDKVFRIKDPLLNSNLEFGARIIYSDQKVYHTSITGFDTFRVLNFKDLEELYGDIHSLSLAGDNLFALQERAVTYIGIGERALETTDALTLSVQSGSFIGNVRLVDSNRGTQHLQSVCSTGNAIYFLDNRNQTINRISGRNVEVISESGLASSLRSDLLSKLDENKVQTIYDPIRKQLWFSNQTGIDTDPFCYVFDEARNMWVSNYTFSTMYGGTYINQKLYLVGQDTSELVAVHSMYTGERTSFFGTYQTPNVIFSVNPDMEIGKRFDVIGVVASNPLDFMNISVERPTSLITQTSNGTSLDVSTRGEGMYKVKILRDSSGARMRGTHAVIDLKWKDNANLQAKVSSVLTTYSHSF